MEHCMTKSRGLKDVHLWTVSEIATLRAAYPDQSSESVAALLWPGCRVTQVYSMAHRLGLKKSAAFMASAASGRLDGMQGRATRFQPGQRPTSNPAAMILAGVATRFRDGQAAHNRVPTGSVTVRTLKGVRRAFVKIEEPNVWRERAKVVWERANGLIPRLAVIHHADTNSLNDDPDNLVALTREQHALVHLADTRAAGFGQGRKRNGIDA